ncbi:response regulator [Myxococcota bacterium]|jgi:CheY-like chemotaxis protein|nr:response regulator [Myxococcota bacterium]
MSPYQPLPGAFEILLVEDDENDIRITERALARSAMSARIEVVRDGQAALDYLQHKPPYERQRRPNLVLLDISLPKVNGMDVLREVKADPTLRSIPVLMLTTSSRAEDVATAYAHGANGYVCKPIHFARFVEVIADLSVYWGKVALLPT